MTTRGESDAVEVGLSHVALMVSDADASIAFYERYARMQVVHRREGATGPVVWLSDLTRPFAIVLIESVAVAGRLEGISHLGVSCASRAEVDERCDEAQREGCLVSGPGDDGPPVGYWALLRDPDGHNLELSFGQEVGRTIDAAGSGSRANPQSSPRTGPRARFT